MIDYDPFRKDVRTDPYPFYKSLRDEAPVYHLPKYNAWAISRFADIWDLSSSERLSTAQGTAPAQVLTKDQPVTPMLNVMDPPEHTRLRKAVRKMFLPGQLRSLQPTAVKMFDELLDDVMERGECDAVQDLAGKLSVKVACLAIGLPIEDADTIHSMVVRFFTHDPDAEGFSPDSLAAIQEMTMYCADRIRECRTAKPDDLSPVNVLAHYEEDGELFDDMTAASHVNMLIIGGTETFPKTFANGILRLWEHPDQRRKLAENPDDIVQGYQEILRYDMPTQFLCRTATDDIELHGQTIKKGDGLMFLYASANRDEREFENPDTFDVTRPNDRILSVGAGIHACLGTHVAKMEGKLTFEAVLKRIPDYEVDVDNAKRLRTEFVQGFESLPIKFEPS